MKKRFSDEQIVAILREGDSGQVSIAEICRNHGISESTFYGWKQKFGTINEPEVRRLRELEKENARLKRLLAERDVEIDVIKEFLQKK
jgi:putative transposase